MKVKQDRPTGGSCHQDNNTGKLDAQLMPGEHTRAIDLCAGVRRFSTQRLQDAASAGDIASWIEACKHLIRAQDFQQLLWIYQLGGNEGYSVDDYVRNNFNTESRKLAAKEAAMAKEMFRKVSALPDKEGHVKVTLKRHRNKLGWDYRVLAVLSSGARLVRDPQMKEAKITEDNPGVMYFLPRSACMNHACDVLFKALRDSGGVGHIRYVPPENMVSAVGDLGGGAVEFMDSATRQTKDSSAFVLAGVMGYFSNEAVIYRIPSRLLRG